jgi:hypothetical protein
MNLVAWAYVESPGDSNLRKIERLGVDYPSGRPTPTPVKNSTADGEVAAAAFALFKKKTSPRDVVIEFEQSPALIQKLQEDWERLGDRVVVGEEILGILDRMSAARLIDEEVVAAIWNNRPERLRAYVDAKLSEHRQVPRT